MSAPAFPRTALSALCLLLAALSPCPAEDAKPDFSEGIRGKLTELTKENPHGIAVLVARDGKVVYEGAFGMADTEAGAKATVETKFRIGSITKQFTAAAILRLAEDGKLTLADPLSKFFPDFPGGEKITLRQLLTHTSGIHSFTEKPDFLARVLKPVTPEELIAYFRNDPPDFAPGEGFRYNNSAYVLAGELVAKISGRSYGDSLKALFLEPLGMKSTGVYHNGSPPPGMAKGYSVTEGKSAPALEWDMSWAGGAGALYSTVGDLSLWNTALHGGKMLKPESLAEMTTPVKLPPGVDGMNGGCGLVMSEMEGLRVISHSGGLHGWSSDLMWLPDQKTTVVALANAMPQAPGLEPGAVTRKIAAKFLEKEISEVPPPKETADADTSRYPDFVGQYDYKSAVLTVTAEGPHLLAQLTGQPKYEIFPSGPDDFFWKVTSAKVAFVRDEKRTVTAARHTQNGVTFTAPRLKEAAVKITEERLAALSGKYQYGPAVMTVSHENGQLFAQLTGQPKMPIFPKSEDEFEWRVVKASVRFTIGAEGKVTKATHSQNGATFDAPKIE